MAISPADFLNTLCDQGSFKELFSEENDRSNVMAGLAEVAGKKTYILADNPVDETRFIEKQMTKRNKVLELILTAPHPLIFISDSAEKRDPKSSNFGIPVGMMEGYMSRRSLGQTFKLVSQLSGKVPTIGYVRGDVAAGQTFIPALCDITVLLEGSKVSLTRLKLVERLSGKRVDPETLSGAKMHCSRSRFGDVFAINDHAAIDWIKKYLTYMPNDYLDSASINIEMKVKEDNAVNRESFDASSRLPFDVRQLINLIVDVGTFLEIREHYGSEVVTGLAKLGGATIGLVANNSARGFGAIYSQACLKISKFVSLCNAYSIPLVFMADSPGFMAGIEMEHSGIIKNGALVFATLSDCVVPIVFINLRKTCGGSMYAMAGSGFADKIIALPNSVFIPHPPDSLAKPRNEDEAQRLKAWEDLKNVELLRSHGYVDEVLEWYELRGYLAKYFSVSKQTIKRHPGPQRILKV